MDQRIKLNSDKTIKYIDCSKCSYQISFVHDITPDELKHVSFDCPKCKQTYFFDDNKIITIEQHNENIRNNLKGIFNKIFIGGNK